MKMDEVKFVCLKCGGCCKDLLSSVGDDIAGLMLFPDEIKLFQKRNIKPCLAIGKSPTHGSFKIITYQFTKAICPYLKNNSCAIYQKRPLLCKGYPFTVSGDLLRQSVSFGVVPECTFIIELREKNPNIRSHDFAYCDEITARLICMEKLLSYSILKHKKIKRWVYDLKTDKWKIDPRDKR